MKKQTLILTGLLGLACCGAAHAELFGLLNGRSADISRSADRSFEGGFGFGDVSVGDASDVDYEHFGARYNYKLNPTTVIYGDVGQTTIEQAREADGITFGIGGFWQVDGVFTGSDFGIHASFHRFDLDIEDSDVSVKGNNIVVEGVFSSKEPINQAGTMYFNGSLGLSRISAKDGTNDTETETELTFSGGVVVQTASGGGEFFGGVLYVDDLGFGAGYRHFLQ